MNIRIIIACLMVSSAALAAELPAPRPKAALADETLIQFIAPAASNGASVVLMLDGAAVFIDPVGNQDQYRRFGRPDIVVLTRAHPDHLSIDTMIGMLRRDTVVLAPQNVIAKLPLMIANNVITPFEIGSSQLVNGITFRALDLNAAPPAGAQTFDRLRGDFGVLIEAGGKSGYF